MHTRSDDWLFGPVHPSSPEERDWYARHAPTVDRWLAELEEAGDPWWQSAEHAAHCLVSDPEFETQGEPRWEVFDVPRFLFESLWNGGTVGFFGSVPIFFDQLVEAMRRFVADGVVDAPDGEGWIAQLLDARADFVRCYDEKTSERDALAIARRALAPRKT